MIRFLYLSLIFFVFINSVNSQTLPEEGRALNYRLIGFSFPKIKNAVTYNIEIAKGHFDTEDSFKRNLIKTLVSTKNKMIAVVPFWGKEYTWRPVGINNKQEKIKSALHHFSTMENKDMDPTRIRLKILQKALKYQDAYVWLDENKAMFDMQGNALWLLPRSTFPNDNVRDLKTSAQGTITFISAEDVYEVNYNGDILWKGPNSGKISKDSTEHYHHEFTRLGNGHYMVLGNEKVRWVSMQNDRDSATKYLGKPGNSKDDIPVSFLPTLIEYDGEGNIVWSWSSTDYFKKSDLYYTPPVWLENGVIDVHANAFYFDESKNIVYLSCKNISRIIKLKYPEGVVLNTYGEIYKGDSLRKGNGLFCQQHSVKLSKKGYLYLFNNNICKQALSPTIILAREPAAGRHDLKKIWEYSCTEDTEYQHRPITSGGNIIELPDNSFFVSIGQPDSKVFIVNKNKKKLWSALPQQWDQDIKRWHIIPQYRASITIDHKTLEKLIYNIPDK